MFGLLSTISRGVSTNIQMGGESGAQRRVMRMGKVYKKKVLQSNLEKCKFYFYVSVTCYKCI